MIEIGIVELHPGDLDKIKRNLAAALDEAHNPAGWRSIHRHGQFGQVEPEVILLTGALQRLAVKGPLPAAVTLEADLQGALRDRPFPFEIRVAGQCKEDGRTPFVPAQEAPTTPLEERFRQLASRWKRETARDSSTPKITEHPDYQAILRMGPEVVPLILDDLRQQPAMWWPALRQLTGENPVPKEDKGKPSRIAEHWLRWGDKHGKTMRQG